MSLFARRKKPSTKHRLLANLWPKLGWIRLSHYLFWRIMRISSAPHDVAAGAAVGIAVSFTPLVGTHFALAALVAIVFRGNVLAALLSTFVGNPLTFPLFWSVSYQVGKVMESYWALPRFVYFDNFLVLRDSTTIFWGSLPVVAVVFVVLYPIFRFSISGFQKRRQKKELAKMPRSTKTHSTKPSQKGKPVPQKAKPTE